MIAEETVARAFARWQPTVPPPTHREFAKRTLLPGGPLKGTAYDPATDPVQSYFVDQLDSGHWESLTWAASPQIAGKTQCAILVPALRAAIALRAAVGYGLPTLHDLDRGWQTKVAPTIKDAGFGAYLPARGPGSKGGRPPSVTFENPDENRAPLGSFVFLAGAARQVTVRVVAIDELDAWRTADGEPRWADIEDCWARADSFQGDAIRIGTGTVECDDPKRSIVLSLVNERGTGTRMWQRCPHCGTYAPASFDQLVYEYQTTAGGPDLQHAAATAGYACASCGVRWSEDDRRAALLAAKFAHKGQTVDAAGIVQGDPPSTRHFGLRTHALDCILTTMGAIAERWATARFALEQHANHEPMRKFWRYQRVEGYSGDLDAESRRPVLDHRELAARSQRTAWSPIVEERDESRRWSRNWALDLPAGEWFGVGSIDVQRNRLYVGGYAFAPDRQSFDLCWSIESARAGTDDAEPPPFGPGELAATLDRAADWIEERLGDRFRLGVADTGDQPDEVAAWLATRPRWVGVRGTGRKGSESISGDPGLPKVSRLGDRTDYDGELDGMVAWERRWMPGMGRWIVATTAGWRAFHAAMRIIPGQPGAAALPGPLKPGNVYLRHLSARGDVPNKSTGVIAFRDLAGRHDWGDVRAYAQAVGLAILSTGRDHVSHPIVTPPPIRPQARGFMHGYNL